MNRASSRRCSPGDWRETPAGNANGDVANAIVHPQRRTLAVTVALLAGLSSRPARAADGDLDSTFGSAGQVMTDLANSTDIANAVALQADGKIVLVGTTYKNNDYSEEDFAVVRYNANGTLDTTFGVNGKVTTDFPGLAAVASSVVVQPDGKILVAGGAFPLFTFLGDIKPSATTRMGQLDTGFGSGGIVTTSFAGRRKHAFSVALQPDGKIVMEELPRQFFQ